MKKNIYMVVVADADDNSALKVSIQEAEIYLKKHSNRKVIVISDRKDTGLKEIVYTHVQTFAAGQIKRVVFNKSTVNEGIKVIMRNFRQGLIIIDNKMLSDEATDAISTISDQRDIDIVTHREVILFSPQEQNKSLCFRFHASTQNSELDVFAMKKAISDFGFINGTGIMIAQLSCNMLKAMIIDSVEAEKKYHGETHAELIDDEKYQKALRRYSYYDFSSKKIILLTNPKKNKEILTEFIKEIFPPTGMVPVDDIIKNYIWSKDQA